jgi:hypothetical protein
LGCSSHPSHTLKKTNCHEKELDQCCRYHGQYTGERSSYLLGIQHPDAMKTVFLVIASLSFGGLCNGQNLVPNPSFEEYTDCPSDISQIERAVGWSTLSGSSDYFNACCPNDSMGVPLNTCGFQLAADGQAYAGVAMYLEGVPYYRENIWAELQTPLSVGVLYHLSMRASPGGYGNTVDNSAHWAARGIGMRLFTQDMELGVHQDNTSLLYMDQVLNDTSQWTTISRDFVADSAYRFILLGNFFSDSLLDVTPLDPNGTFGAYAFIDEVCISAQDGVCDIAQQVPDRSETLASVCGSIFGSELRVRQSRAGQGALRCVLRDLTGRMCKSGFASGPELVWNTRDLPTGQFLLTVEDPEGHRMTVRLIHLIP